VLNEGSTPVIVDAADASLVFRPLIAPSANQSCEWSTQPRHNLKQDTGLADVRRSGMNHWCQSCLSSSLSSSLSRSSSSLSSSTFETAGKAYQVS
jgi:hypothetical protein